MPNGFSSCRKGYRASFPDQNLVRVLPPFYFFFPSFSLSLLIVSEFLYPITSYIKSVCQKILTSEGISEGFPFFLLISLLAIYFPE